MNMQLRDFDLDLPYVENIGFINMLIAENNLEYYEATKIDYEQNWKSKRIQFRDETRCITSLYADIFPKFITDDCSKILVECVETITNDKIRNYSGVVAVQIPIGVNQYFNANEHVKKKMSLEFLQSGIELILQDKDWDKSVFKETYLAIINRNYENSWVWKQKISPDKNLTALVYCEHGVYEFKVWIIIKNREGEAVKRVMVISERPKELAYAEHLGDLIWRNQNEVVLINEDNTQQSIVYI